MSIYNEYLTGMEREFAIEEAKIEAEFSKYFTMLEMVELQHEQMLKDAELKVLVESGTYDDLAYLITEADAEVAGQSKGIFASIISAIAKLFTTIGEKIRQIFNITDDDMIVEVDPKAVEKQKELNTCITRIQSGIGKIKNKDWAGALGDFKNIVVPTVALSGAAAAGVALHKKYKAGELKSVNKSIEDALAKLKKYLEDLKPATTESFTDKAKQKAIEAGLLLVQKLTSAVNTITNHLTGAINKAKGLLNKNKSQDAENTDDAAEGNGDNANSETDGADETKDATPADNGAEPDAPKKVNSGVKVVSTPQQVGKFKWKVLSNGEAVWFDEAAKKWKRSDFAHPVPSEINNLIKHLKKTGKVQESYDIDEIQAVLGENFFIETAEDGIIITMKDSSVVTESTSHSIFGYDLENEQEIQESADAFDQELDELEKLFRGL